jgi:hypothetical protein
MLQGAAIALFMARSCKQNYSRVALPGLFFDANAEGDDINARRNIFPISALAGRAATKVAAPIAQRPGAWLARPFAFYPSTLIAKYFFDFRISK